MSAPISAPMSATSALVAYLRAEADMAEERARRLRAQAEAMAGEMGVAAGDVDAAAAPPVEMAPLDEFGVPKYKGRKRGRKPKKRKRQRRPDAPKRQHTAYTLFVQENYPAIRSHNPALQSKDVISIVARQWANVGEGEKTAWRDRARATNVALAVKGEDDDDEEEEEEGDGDEEDDGGGAAAVEDVDGVPPEEVMTVVTTAGVAAAEDDDDGEGEGEDEDTEDEEDLTKEAEEEFPQGRKSKRGKK